MVFDRFIGCIAYNVWICATGNQNVQDEDCKGLEFMDVSTVQYWCIPLDVIWNTYSRSNNRFCKCNNTNNIIDKYRFVSLIQE